MTAVPRRGPGRPADGGDRRALILDAARGQFASKGYAGASVRAIAREAGVDPALVHHYFNTKEQLFVAAMELPVNPGDLLPDVLTGDLDHVGERLVRMFLQLWSRPDFREPFLGIVRSAFTSEQGAAMLREFVGSALLARVSAAVGSPPPLRVEAAAAQLVGVVLLRHVVRIEPLASAPEEELVALLAPTVQRYLTGG